jgi:hypothetical protein
MNAQRQGVRRRHAANKASSGANELRKNPAIPKQKPASQGGYACRFGRERHRSSLSVSSREVRSYRLILLG